MDVREEFKFWRELLDGKEPQLTEDVQCGYYASTWFKDSGVLPIAIWLDPKTSEQVCYFGFSEDSGAKHTYTKAKPETVQNNWLRFCRYPIEYDLYTEMFAKGPPWPGEAIVERIPHEPGHLGHNKPPEGLELLKHELREIIESTRKHLKTPEQDWDKAWADACSGFLEKIRKKRKEIDGERVEKKEPHRKAAEAVDAVYKPMLQEANKWNDTVRKAVTRFKEIEDQKAREELVRQAQEVAAGERDISEVNLARPVEKVGGKTSGNVTGRATGFRTVKKAKITDYKKALTHFREADEIKNMVQSLCDREARAGNKGPGWEIDETKVAT